MKTVSRFEANLLQILRFLLGKAPESQAMLLLQEAQEAPAGLSRAALDLVQDTLAKGCVLRLGHVNGWRRERFLRTGKPAEGRLWERTPPEELGLGFSRHALRFLIWLTSAQLPTKMPLLPFDELLTGDWLLFYFAYGAMRSSALGVELRRYTPFRGNALCRLAFAEDFADAPAVPDFGRWTVGVGACILEALQDELAQRWIETERAKANIGDGKILRALGESQERVLDAYLAALEAAGRRDLARFFLSGLGEVLSDADNPYQWVEKVDLSRERLADRMETYRAILAPLVQLQRLKTWTDWARGIGFLDEDYAAAQLWKEDWEQTQGDELCRKAHAIIRRWEEWKK
jgi:hypothetical protein